MYLLLLTIGQCALYAVLACIYTAFFGGTRPLWGRFSFASLGVITAVSMGSYVISFLVPDIEWGNRVMHALGGGVTTSLVCFLVVRDFRVPVNKFQFFVFSALMVTAIGVGNEILEYFTQNYFGLTFNTYLNDTWLDLMSNVVGTLFAGAILTPFIKSSRGGA